MKSRGVNGMVMKPTGVWPGMSSGCNTAWNFMSSAFGQSDNGNWISGLPSKKKKDELGLK